MAASATWQKAAREFFNERAEEIAGISPTALCHVSGREQRLWTQRALYNDLMRSLQIQLDLAQEQHLLEVGCAAGFLSSGVAAMVRRYTGADIAAKAIDVAHSLGIANADFALVDGKRLPWADGSFDRVMAYDVFTNFPDFESVAQVVRDMVRVCRPGGKVLAGSLADENRKEEYQQHTQRISKQLDSEYGPRATVRSHLSLRQRLRRWLTRNVARLSPDLVCYYFRRADFMALGRDLGLRTDLFDIHQRNPYHGYRFNVVYSKPTAQK